jgi:glutamate-1-semialdehyde 2,1-aminomutase
MAVTSERLYPGPSAAARAAGERAHRVVPGGAHTYAKGDDQFPSNAPPVLVRGRGSRVWDLDGEELVEYGGGLRANLLGHAHPAVVEAVQRAVAEGTNLVRPSPLEAEVAEDLLDFVGRPGWMAKFTKDGSDANDAAIRLARAVTGRDRVLICRTQPFFSVGDWFIGTTPMAAGVPQAVRALVGGFDYGDVEGLRAELAAGDVAVVVLEAAKYEHPPEGFLAGVRAACDEAGALFLLDEMITGMRWPGGSALRLYDARPDLVTYGKALGNGVAVSALVGRPELMARGGLRTDAERVFLLSTTHGAEHLGLAAARAVLGELRRRDAGRAMQPVGEQLAARLDAVARRAGVGDHLRVQGLPQALVFTTADAEGRPSQALRALAMQEMVRGRVLGTSLVLSTAHDAEDLDLTEAAWERVADVYARALESGTDGLLEGGPTKPVFRRYA